MKALINPSNEDDFDTRNAFCTFLFNNMYCWVTSRHYNQLQGYLKSVAAAPYFAVQLSVEHADVIRLWSSKGSDKNGFFIWDPPLPSSWEMWEIFVEKLLETWSHLKCFQEQCRDSHLISDLALISAPSSCWYTTQCFCERLMKRDEGVWGIRITLQSIQILQSERKKSCFVTY